MTHFYSKKLVLSAGLVLLLANCGKDKATPVVAYAGQVNLYDEFGAAIPNASGVAVSLYDDASISTQTAADGRFTLQVPTTGAQRLVFKKQNFGVYYSPAITATGSSYAFSKPIKLGQGSWVSYAYTVVPDNIRKQVVITGTMYSRLSAPIAPGPRTHRVFLDPTIGYDGYPTSLGYKYSKLRLNNTPTGFSDTIAYSMLVAAGLLPSRNVAIAVHSDNPAADSCQYPVGTTWYSKTYPAIGTGGSPPGGGGTANFYWVY